MTDDGVGDIPHEGTLQPAEPSAAYHYQTGADIFGQVNDRLVPSLAHLQMSDSYGAVRLFDLPNLFVQHLLGLASNGLAPSLGLGVVIVDSLGERSPDDNNMER